MSIRVFKNFSSSGAGASAAFTVMQADKGTSPVADSTSDTLTFTSVDDTICITGDAATDTLDFVITDNADIMRKESGNTMTTAGDILFPVITNVVGEVDAFRLPALAGTPSAIPTAGGEGYMVWDSTNDILYGWDGVTWINLSNVFFLRYMFMMGGN